jgi:hypothetical protein
VEKDVKRALLVILELVDELAGELTEAPTGWNGRFVEAYNLVTSEADDD